MDVGLIDIDQLIAIALCAVPQRAKVLDELHPPRGIGTPNSLRAFFQENPSRCRAERMLSRHSRRSKRSCTNPTRRLSVQRGGGSAPAIGGSAAACWAVRIALPRAAAIRGEKGGGRRCADTAAPRGRVCCRRAPSPSPSADGARY